MSNAFVCIMGIGIVFAGLIVLVLITYLMSAVCKFFAKPESASSVNNAPAANAGGKIANKQEIIAASCAVIAEELGTDVSNIKVTSFKKL
jgi:sodium pump decarboxylase gamma subunit